MAIEKSDDALPSATVADETPPTPTETVTTETPLAPTETVATETPLAPADTSVPAEAASDEAPLSSVENARPTTSRPWYARLNEDWLATLAGLVLVILLVVGWLHSIP